MQRKNKVTLGLLIFFLGALMAACGGNESSNTPAATNNNNLPDNFDTGNYGCSDSCERDYDGTFRITDADEYLETFGYENSSGSNLFGDGFFNQVLGEVATSIADPVMGAVRCGTEIYVTRGIAELFGIDDIDVECSIVDSEYSFMDGLNGNSQDIGTTRPRATAELAIYRNEVDAIRLTIRSDLGTDQMVFDSKKKRNIFESRKS